MTMSAQGSRVETNVCFYCVHQVRYSNDRLSVAPREKPVIHGLKNMYGWCTVSVRVAAIVFESSHELFAV